MDPLTVLVREAAQNSWDARDGSDRPVVFEMAGRTLGDAVVRTLQEDVFGTLSDIGGLPLNDELRVVGLAGLYISDRNTKGLGGPIQANQVDSERKYDWADFVLNVGKASTQEHSGGTYGFGKTIAYVVSKAHTIVIHTRTSYLGKPVTRLIASTIGNQFDLDGTLFTGRHWWGREKNGGPVPVENAEADALALDLGMPLFSEGEFGTNILVLSPDFGDRTPQQGMTFISESILWHLWPKMIADDHGGAMSFGISWNDEKIPVPVPEDRPPLQAFVKALRAITTEQPPEEQPPGLQRNLIARKRPKTEVGDLATLPVVVQLRAEVDDGSDPENDDSPRPASPFADQSCHHVALLRTPELVVDYVSGAPSPEGGIEWAGVFRVREAHDNTFALAEPPTHDSWQPSLLPDRTDRSIVSKALSDIQMIVAARWGSSKPEIPTSVSSTSVVADALGYILGPVAAQGKGRPEQPAPTSRHQVRKAKIELLSAGPQIIDGSPATFARLRVTPRSSTQSTRLRIEIGVALEGAASDDSIDSNLRLLNAVIGESSHPLNGHQAFISIPGNAQCEVLLLAKRSLSSAILWKITVEESNEIDMTA